MIKNGAGKLHRCKNGAGHCPVKKEKLRNNRTVISELLYYDPYGNRTHDYAVKGRRLNLLTNGPWMAATGFEPVTDRV